jgi:Fe2+ transport system protein FeoA
MLATLEAAGLIPGTRVEVLSVAADGAIAVSASQQVIALSRSTSSAILVRFGDLQAI